MSLSFLLRDTDSWVSLALNIGQITCSGLDLGVLCNPIGDVNIEFPSDGIRVGTKLVASLEEDWQTVTWDWQRSNDGIAWTNVAGNGNEYTITTQDDGSQIRAIASVYQLSGAHVGKAASEPVQVGVVLIVRGGGALDEELTAEVVQQDKSRVQGVTFEWKRLPKNSGAAVELTSASSSGEASTYVPCVGDIERQLRVTATYDDEGEERTLSCERDIGKLVTDSAIYIDGVETTTAQVGDELDAKEGTGGQAARFAYSWHLNDASGTNLAETRSYLVALACGGKGIVTRMQYTAANDEQVPAQPVNSSAVMIAEPTVTVTPAAPRVGDTLTAAVNITERAAATGKGFSVKYQWYDKSNPSAMLADSKSYTPKTHGQYQVQVTLHDNANGEQLLWEKRSPDVTVAPA